MIWTLFSRACFAGVLSLILLRGDTYFDNPSATLASEALSGASRWAGRQPLVAGHSFFYTTTPPISQLPIKSRLQRIHARRDELMKKNETMFWRLEPGEQYLTLTQGLIKVVSVELPGDRIVFNRLEASEGQLGSGKASAYRYLHHSPKLAAEVKEFTALRAQERFDPYYVVVLFGLDTVQSRPQIYDRIMVQQYRKHFNQTKETSQIWDELTAYLHAMNPRRPGLDQFIADVFLAGLKESGEDVVITALLRSIERSKKNPIRAWSFAWFKTEGQFPSRYTAWGGFRSIPEPIIRYYEEVLTEGLFLFSDGDSPLIPKTAIQEALARNNVVLGSYMPSAHPARATDPLTQAILRSKNNPVAVHELYALARQKILDVAPHLSEAKAIIPMPGMGDGVPAAWGLARFLGQDINRPVLPVLRKTNKSISQKKMPDRVSRARNSAGTIVPVAGPKLPKTVLVVDDVESSGLTAAAARVAAMDGGAQRVIHLAFANTEWEQPAEMSLVSPLSQSEGYDAFDWMWSVLGSELTIPVKSGLTRRLIDQLDSETPPVWTERSLIRLRTLLMGFIMESLSTVSHLKTPLYDVMMQLLMRFPAEFVPYELLDRILSQDRVENRAVLIVQAVRALARYPQHADQSIQRLAATMMNALKFRARIGDNNAVILEAATAIQSLIAHASHLDRTSLADQLLDYERFKHGYFLPGETQAFLNTVHTLRAA